MKRPVSCFNLLSLLLLPAMFAIGWWTRGINYNRDVYVAAETIAWNSGGTFVPELGMILGGGDFGTRFNSMSPIARKEMDRRLEYFASEMEATFDPPKPGVIESVVSLFSDSEEGTRDTLVPDGDDPDASRRDSVEAFREAMHQRFSVQGHGVDMPSEGRSEP